MLVVTRRATEAIQVGTDIVVRVIRVDGDRVVLGIDAPREVPIVRVELVDEVSAEVRAAAGGAESIRGLLSGR